jgi:hypothetical protein
VASHLADFDIREVWEHATNRERWAPATEVLDSTWIYPDHLEAKISGVPKMTVTLQEAGLTGGPGFHGVGEPSVDQADRGWRIGLCARPAG